MHRLLVLLLPACALGLTTPPRGKIGSVPRPVRRAVIGGAVGAVGGLVLQANPASGSGGKSRIEGYEVQRPLREWQYVLSGQQYFILREGGTEAPNSSPLAKECSTSLPSHTLFLQTDRRTRNLAS